MIAVPIVFLGALFLFVFMIKATGSKAAECVIGSCPTELHATDRGKTFIYAVGSRFVVILDSRTDRPEHIRCEPRGVIGAITDIPTVEPPLFALHFEGLENGSCDLRGDYFWAHIIVRETAR